MFPGSPHLQLLDVLVGAVQLDLAEALVQAVHEVGLGDRVHGEGILKLQAVLALGVRVLLQFKVAIHHLLKKNTDMHT